MEILSDYSLKLLNTFNINVDGKYFTRVASLQEIREALEFARTKKIPLLILGGGSNILFTHDFNGLVMKVDLKGVKIIKESNDHYYVKAGAGETWDDFVSWCVDRNYAGLENLSLIPGSVGASPVQNIGAYGVEMKDCFFELEYYNIQKEEIEVYSEKDCNFQYRNSIFKQNLKGQGIVLSVTFKLDKIPVFKTEYGSIKEELGKLDAGKISVKNIRQAVINIRSSKLPDPEEIGNAGSFFKNPVISMVKQKELIKTFPDLVYYKQKSGDYKLAAGWLIDQCNWKGFRKGDAGVHEKQALVIVNHGNASGEAVFELSREIQDSVKNKFGVVLEREVNVF